MRATVLMLAMAETLPSGNVLVTLNKGMTVSATLTCDEAIEWARAIERAALVARARATSTDTCPVCMSFGRNCCVAHKVELTK